MATLSERWAAAMSSGVAQQKYKDKINAVSVNPMELAAAAVESGKYLAGVQRSIASGKMAKKLRAVSAQAWKTAATTVGVQNMVTGAAKGKPKMAAAEATILQAGAAAKAAAHAAGDGALGRVAAAIRAVQQAWGYTPTI